MDAQNRRDVVATLRRPRGADEGLFLLRQFEPSAHGELPRELASTEGVFDPYGASAERFDQVYAQVERCVEALIEWAIQSPPIEHNFHEIPTVVAGPYAHTAAR